MDYNKDFVAQCIKNYRAAHALSQTQLANKIGISAAQIMRWENKKTIPNKLSAKALQEFKIIP